VVAGERRTGDHYVCALPFERLEALGLDAPHFEHSPITGVHLWFDREITTLEHAVLLDREIHWLYNKSRLQPWRGGKGGYVELVVSAARGFAERPSEEAIAQAVGELAEFFPLAASARLEKAVRVKEMRATFGVPPGIDASRPTSVSPWPNCFLAGDWTATGWPSTMESAARSGHLAAEAVCAGIKAPRSFLYPDLKPRGLMRLMAAGL